MQQDLHEPQQHLQQPPPQQHHDVLAATRPHPPTPASPSSSPARRGKSAAGPGRGGLTRPPSRINLPPQHSGGPGSENVPSVFSDEFAFPPALLDDEFLRIPASLIESVEKMRHALTQVQGGELVDRTVAIILENELLKSRLHQTGTELAYHKGAVQAFVRSSIHVKAQGRF